jgi:hypothetical protein
MNTIILHASITAFLFLLAQSHRQIYFMLRPTSTKEKAYLRLQISSGTSGLDQYWLRYRVGGNSVNTKPVSGSSVNRKSVSGSSVISKVFWW